MGIAIDRETFDDSDRRAFRARLEDCLSALGRLLAHDGFGEGPPSIGAEVELSIVDGDARPFPINRQLLAESADPQLQLELDRFNLEYNLTPVALSGRPLSALEAEMRQAAVAIDRLAGQHAGRSIRIGILPTLRERDLQAHSMSDLPRFRALSRELRALRGEDFAIQIDGDEPLQTRVDDVTMEGAATSLQVHLRVRPRDFADLYNCAQLASAPAVVVSANSPLFLGHRLWDETRVALFKQAVDVRGPEVPRRIAPARVTFGHGWVRRGVHELFAETVALFPPLLPVCGEQDPLEQLGDGVTPALHELRLHASTVWRWNRPVFDPADGGHLRIELRALPSGPTSLDAVANIAFLVGLTRGLALETERLLPVFPFAYAEHNFYRAAKHGFDAELLWPDPEGSQPRQVPARRLLGELVPIAAEGLDRLGVDAHESDRYLRVIQARIEAGQNPANWQRQALARLERRMSREAALAELTHAYLHECDRDLPAHEWSLPG